jgi:signal transduction histidine kinase
MSFFEGNQFSGESTAQIARIIDSTNTGIWDYNTITKKANWSAGFYTMLGYEHGEIECSYQSFLENILYYDDKKLFLKNIEESSSVNITTVHIRLLTKTNGYQWFESTSQKNIVNDVPILYGVLRNIHQYKAIEFKAGHQTHLTSEIGRVAKIGGWELDVASQKLTLGKEIYNIYELQDNIELSLDEALSFFEPFYRPIITQAVEDAIKYCKPYDHELLFRTAKNNVIWVRSKGAPIVDEYGKCVTVRGIFQDIDKIKKKGLTMQSSINLLDDQNKRLQNFAYIVSHNLRSHAGNLKFMVSLYDESEEDREEIFLHIKSISDSLNSTIDHLDEIVRIQSEIGKERKLVDFEAIFENVKLALTTNIASSNAVIDSNFNNSPQINYIPAYLESIFQNLLTNAIKYKHPDRNPVIKCYTEKDGSGTILIFEDNGIGIDMQRYGDDIFGMYKTFHANKDAKGIGLFITRNQVEALGGSIKIESTVDVGTKFTIKLV